MEKERVGKSWLEQALALDVMNTQLVVSYLPLLTWCQCRPAATWPMLLGLSIL